MAKKKKRFPDEIERDSNRFLEDILDKIFIQADAKLRPYGIHTLKEKGIDYWFEIEERTYKTNTIGDFYVQNKGQDSILKPNIKGEYKGKISFQLDDFRQVEYFCFQLDKSILVTVCDLKSKIIYWHPIQLDSESLQGRIAAIKNEVKTDLRKGNSIQIYIDPEKKLCERGKVLHANFSKFIDDIKKSKKEQVYKYQSGLMNYLPFVDETINVLIDKTKLILDQIHEYISLSFSEVNNVPNHILTRSYPFKKEDSFFPYYSTFSLSTDNEELFEFFKSIKITKDGNLEFSETKFINGVDEYDKKTKEVLKRLSSNLIFNLESKKSHKRINIIFPENKKCNCIRCKYNRFQFGEAFKDLIAKPKEIGNLLRLAYVQYQVGNFIDASKLLLKIAEKAKKQDKKTTQFITEYNLSMLSVFIRNHYWGENSQDELVKKLKGINIDNQFAKLKTSKNEKLLVWIKNSSFYSEANDRIHKTVSKIRDHYYSQLKGGLSSNNQVWELINEYAEIDTFLNNNFIIYDAYSEFRELTEAFIEGIFASHAISEPHNSRLSSFDDWLIQKILYYGKAETILKYFVRYHLKGLVYKPTSKKGDTFLEIIDNFLSGYSETIKAFKEHCEKDNRYFWNRYNTLFSNILALAGLCDLDKDQINEIANKLLIFLKSEKSIYPYNIKYVRLFINRKGNELNKSTLKSFLIFAINNGKYHSEDFFEAVANQIKKRGCIKLTDKQFEKIERISFGKCPKCKQSHSPILIVHIHRIIEDNTIREKIKLAIENYLSKSFNAELYYFAAIYEILGVDGNFFTQFVNACVPNQKQVSFRKAFSGEDDNRHPRINMLINLCYKYNVDLSSNQFDQFRKIDVYYDWLLDLANFNYDEFDPKWVSEYTTKYYFEKIKQITIIKDKISEYLKYNIEPQLERDYINIFCIEK